jgi:hypothetical protein
MRKGDDVKDLVSEAPPDGRRVDRSSAYRRDMRFFAALATVAVSVVAVTACSGSPGQARQAQPSAARPSLALTSPASANGCARHPPVSPLPVWARSGFTPPDIAMPHVMGAAGNIVAILWATPNALHAPALPNMANKILWMSRVSSGPMTIRAHARGQYAHRHRGLAERSRTLVRGHARARLLDAAPELGRAHRPAEPALRALTLSLVPSRAIAAR